MEKPNFTNKPSKESMGSKDILTLENIRRFIVDKEGNAEVIEEGKDRLVLKRGGRTIKIVEIESEEEPKE